MNILNYKYLNLKQKLLVLREKWGEKGQPKHFEKRKLRGKKAREGRGRKGEGGMGERKEEAVEPNISNTKISVTK